VSRAVIALETLGVLALRSHISPQRPLNTEISGEAPSWRCFVRCISLLDGAPDSMELRNHLDGAMDVSVELGQVFSRNPVFQMRCPAYLLWFKARQIGRVDLELGDEASMATPCVLGVPLARNLFGVLAVQDGVKDGLLRQARRELPKAAAFDELEFSPGDWPIERRGHRGSQAPILPLRPSNTQISGEAPF